MPVSDSIGDFLTRIRNASKARHKTVEVPSSKVKLAIADILQEQGYITGFERIEDGKQGVIKVALRYHQGESVIKDIKRVSTPGRKTYVGADELPRVQNGLGVAIISTSHGVMTDKKARQQNVGGEVLCTIW